jgi:dienelactone hydrolase
MVPGGNMPVYYARLANAQNPPIVLVAMEIFGLHEYIKDVTRRLGHLGAFAVARASRSMVSLADAHSDAMPQNALESASQVKEPVLGLYGADDAGIKVEQVKAMEEKLKSAGKTAEFHIYPGAPHGFHADYRPSYRKEAAADGWNRMIEWFKKYKVLA